MTMTPGIGGWSISSGGGCPPEPMRNSRCETAPDHPPLPHRRIPVTRIDPPWLEAFDEELLHLFAIDHRDAGMDE
jgi:hypothetical protein